MRGIFLSQMTAAKSLCRNPRVAQFRQSRCFCGLLSRAVRQVALHGVGIMRFNLQPDSLFGRGGKFVCGNDQPPGDATHTRWFRPVHNAS